MDPAAVNEIAEVIADEESSCPSTKENSMISQLATVLETSLSWNYKVEESDDGKTFKSAEDEK